MMRSRIQSAYDKWSNFTDEHAWVFPVFLFLIAIVTYGIFIFSLGFYWDDWSPLMLLHNPDPSALWRFYLSDRPFQSWTYYVLFPICRDSTIAWQFSAIFFRWTATIALYFTFLKIFPKQKQLLQWSAILFLVFPGFADIYASVSFGSHFMTYTVFGLSMLTMVLAFKNKRLFWIYYPLSIILAAAHMLTMEYFVGLEMLRPILIFILFTQNEKKSWKIFWRSIIQWLPYLFVFAGFVYWRMVIYPGIIGGQHESNTPYLLFELLKTPINTLVTFAKTIFSDVKFLLINSWTDRLLPEDLPIDSITFWLSLFLGFVTILIVYFFQLRKNVEKETASEKKQSWLNIGIGFFIILFGMFPVWSTLRQITKGKWSDRFGLAAMFGAVLIIVTTLYAAIQNKKIRNAFLICVVGLSIGFQIRSGNIYRKDFDHQKSFYKELAWRIPSLTPGTAIYSPGIPTDKASDYSYTMGINLLYSYGVMGESVNYWFITPRDFSGEALLKNPDVEIKENARTLTFIGSGRNIVIIYMPPTGCLWVINPYYAIGNTTNGSFPNYAKISNEDLIFDQQTIQTSNLNNIINLGAEDTWCYYFEKGDLAQSKGDWQKAVSYYEKAASENLVPAQGIERLPFIEAYAKLGKFDQALNLSQEMVKKTISTKPMLCQFWSETLIENTTLSKDMINSFYNIENCPEYFK